MADELSASGLREMLNTDAASALGLLASVLREFDGASDSRMAAWKLERMEDVHWSDPILTFRIERHGSMAVGGTRAELQRWELNFETMTARWFPDGYRQLRPRAERVNTAEIARELLQNMLNGEPDDRVTVHKDGSMSVKRSELWPDAYARTREGRVQRLFHDLRELCPPELMIDGRRFRRRPPST